MHARHTHVGPRICLLEQGPSRETVAAPTLPMTTWNSMSASVPLEPGIQTIFVEQLAPRLVLTRLEGRPTHACSTRALKEFERMIAGMERPVWVSDATRLTGFEPRSLALGARWFAAFKQRGGQDCLVVSHWEMAMMAASTMALGLGVRLQNFATLTEATEVAQKLVAAR